MSIRLVTIVSFLPSSDPSLNLLRQTIDSFSQQSYHNKLLLLKIASPVPVNSIDMEIVGSENIRVIYRADKNLYDGLNQAFDALLPGDFVNVFGAGDVFYDRLVLEKVAGTIVEKNVTSWLAGDIIRKRAVGDSVLKEYHVGAEKSLVYGRPAVPEHPNVFASVNVYLLEYYDVKYKIAGDIDWMLRVLSRFGPPVKADVVVGVMAAGGISQEDRLYSLRARELYDIARRFHGKHLPYLYVRFVIGCLYNLLKRYL